MRGQVIREERNVKYTEFASLQCTMSERQVLNYFAFVVGKSMRVSFASLVNFFSSICKVKLAMLVSWSAKQTTRYNAYARRNRLPFMT